MNDEEFKSVFASLTGHQPLAWQVRLFRDHFASDKLPHVIDLPTGLGKTMAMAIWLIAWTKNKKLPRRLIYVVDRRTVVDQASDLAKTLQDRAGSALDLPHLAISTLRGQLADNREWSRDPSRPAIIIGTVDLIGSGLLFSGYRSSFKQRPLEAGMLGQDSLLLLDEAHLSKPFAKLIGDIDEDGRFQRDREGGYCGIPMKVIRMSATSTDDEKARTFKLTGKFKARTGDFADSTIHERFGAKKTLTIRKLSKVDPTALADEAMKLADRPELNGKRIVIFVRRPDDAAKIADRIRASGKTKTKSGQFENAVVTLTGTMRGLERDKLLEDNAVMKRFLEPDDPALANGPCFLVSTSAGEVGFDLNGDNMVCDATTLDSLIQRLGRVNRRGKGDAVIIMLVESDPKVTTALDKAIQSATALLTSGMDVSPKAIADLKSEWGADKVVAASSPDPAMVELTDILLDAWSMTSIAGRMPGRPDVAPWLRGIDDELQQTTIAWRAELNLLSDDPDRQAKYKIIFAKHRIRPHEALTTNSSRVVEFLQKITKDKSGWPELKKTEVVVKLTRDLVLKSIGEIIDNPGILYAEPTLILPATIGGLASGMLSPEAVAPAAPPPESLDVADASGYESSKDLAARRRLLLQRTDDGRWKPMPLPFGKAEATSIASFLGLEGESWDRSTITESLRKRKMRIQRIIKCDFDDEGDASKLLLLLSGIGTRAKYTSQSLGDHIGDVERQAKRIADEFGLDKTNAFRVALCFAAKWHDDGKRSPVWQRFIGGTDEVPWGKSAEYCDPKKLAGYRHEFGSLLRVLHPDPAESREKPQLPADEHARDLALHLIVVHHGYGRPHFDRPIDRDFHQVSLIGEAHSESIRRFARLQRKYGWWQLAWLENLLRCADQIASAQVNDEEDQEDDGEGESL